MGHTGRVLVDAHAHLDRYGKRLDAALAGIRGRQILTMAVSLDVDSYRRLCGIAAQCDLVVPAFGVHPWEAHRWADRIGELDDLIEEAPMIGEVGLDHRWVEDETRYEPQRAVFRYFLARAAELDRVVNLHCAGAETETLDLLESVRGRRVVVHWYSGPLEVLEEMVAAGCYFTVGVELPLSDTIRRVAERIPDTQLLTETDNPDGLEWLTGEVGMPEHLNAVLEGLARIRGTTPEAIEGTVAQNLARLVRGDRRLEAWAAPVLT